MTTHETPTGMIGRPRDSRIDEAVLAATRRLVADVGYADLTFRAVAAAAGTSVPAIRRRWDSKLELVVDAVYPPDMTVRESGADDLRSEVHAVVLRVMEILGTPEGRRATPSLMGEFMADRTRLEHLVARFREGAWAPLATLMAAAAERDEVRRDVDLRSCVETIFGAVLIGLLMRGPEAIDEAWAETLTDVLVDGIRSRPVD